MNNYGDRTDGVPPKLLNPYEAPSGFEAGPLNDKGPISHRSFRMTLEPLQPSPHFVVGGIRSAVCFTLLQQWAWIALATYLPIGDQLLPIAFVAALIFWLLFLTTLLAQQARIDPEQILALKWGYVPMFLTVANGFHLIQLLI